MEKRRQPVIWAVGLGGAALAVLYFALPQGAADLVYLTLAPVPGTLMLVAAARRRPSCPRAWVLFGMGFWLFAAGDIVWSVADHRLPDGMPFPSVADAVYLVGTVCMFGGVLALIRSRRPGRDLAAALDAGVVAVSFGLVLFVYVMAHYTGDHTMSLPARAVALAYPMSDVALLVMVLSFAFRSAPRNRASSLLVTALVVWVATDTLYAVLSVQDRYRNGMWIDAGWIAAYVLWAMVAWHPDAAHLDEVPSPHRRVTWRRMALLALASLVAPGVLAVQGLTGGRLYLPEVIGASAVLFLLVVLRLARLVGEMHELAVRDRLTGLPNRSVLEEQLADALAEVEGTEGTVAVLFVDLDRFKLVNDLLGHAAGDSLLREVGARIRAQLRTGDMVARYAGDEFVAVLRDAGTVEAVEVAERLVAALAEPVWIDGAPVFPSASVGIAVSARDERDPDSLLRDADAAMFRAKVRTDARYELFDAAMRERSLGKLELEAALRASADARFEVHYQPVVRLADEAIVGFEALVRWRDAGGRLVPPLEFLGVAEETGIITRIGRLVLEDACRFGVHWRQVHGRDVRMFVNLSGRELAQLDLVAEVEEALTGSGLDRSLLVVEVSERALGEHNSEAVLRNIEALDVTVALDDFGTGTSALPQIRRHPYGLLKLDRSLVDGIATSPRERAIVHGIVTIAEDLGIELVAEGVEDPADVVELRALGCGLVQGYLFGRPAEAASWLVPATSSARSG